MKVFLIDTPEDPVRLGFLHVFKKRPGMQNDDGSKSPDKFEATPIIRPDGANAKRIREAIEQVAKDKYGEKPTKSYDRDGNLLGEVPTWRATLDEFQDDQKGLRNGNLKRNQSNEIYDGFEGNLYVVARNETRPTVIDRDRTALAEEDGRPYSGCYGNVQIDIWALNKPKMKKRIVSDLLGVQFTRDGDAFSGGSSPTDPEAFPSLDAGAESGNSMLDD